MKYVGHRYIACLKFIPAYVDFYRQLGIQTRGLECIPENQTWLILFCLASQLHNTDCGYSTIFHWGFALSIHRAQVHSHWLVIAALLVLKKSDPCPQVSFWGLVSKTYVRVHSNLHPAVHWGVALNVKNKQNPRNIFLKKGTVFVLWKVSLSLEDKTIPFSHLECLSSFLIGSPASCLVPIQSILHPESREILLKRKSGHLSLPCLQTTKTHSASPSDSFL